MSRTPTPAEQQAILVRLERFSRFTDASIGLPFTRFKIGVEPLVGLIPGIGDVVGLAMSAYVLLEARRAGANGKLMAKMLRNVGIDFAVGLLPVVGDAFDAVFKANLRNTRLLRDHLSAQLGIVETPPKRFPWRVMLGLTVLFGVVLTGAALLF